MLLDRLLTKCSEHLSIFAAPVVLDRDYDLIADACNMVIDVVRQNVPFVAVDLPHTWTSWTKRILLSADEIVITAVPDLANLRNAKNIIDLLKQSRTNDGPPHLVHQHGRTCRSGRRFRSRSSRQRLDLKPLAIIEFDSETFGQAANNGQMIEELSTRRRKPSAPIRDLAMALAHRKEQRVEPKKSALGRLAPLLEKLKLKR
ncbi:MAG: hypothetical protein QM784_05545 [Polyangiaceae bacterium]